MLKKLLCACLILMLAFSFNINVYATDFSSAPNPPKISAKSAILMDMESGNILYAYNEHERLYPASITKILTALIALEYNQPNDTITFSYNSIFGIDRESANLAIDVGEQVNMTDALYCLLLASANEVAMGIAEHIGGSIENFCEMMNLRAMQAGALNSNFKNGMWWA